jgi:hypothetical protein
LILDSSPHRHTIDPRFPETLVATAPAFTIRKPAVAIFALDWIDPRLRKSVCFNNDTTFA